MKEAKMLQSELPAGIVCIPREECLDRYHAQIDGPPSTPYERGRFSVDVSLSSCYPMEPPSMRFETRIYHPNIDDHGNICLDVLKSGKNGCWTPSWTLAKVLVALSVLLATPNPHDPLMPDIADQMLSDGSAYMAAAREWTARYAAPSAEDAAAEPDTSVGTAVPSSDAGDGESPTKRRK
ncbi:Ubiquitin-conjugating enzyme E2 T, partial [Coemansia biformis]